MNNPSIETQILALLNKLSEEQVTGKKYFLDFRLDYECVEGSPEWLRQKIRQSLLPNLTDSERTQLFLFLSGLPIAAYSLVPFKTSKGTSEYLNLTQFSIDAIFVLLSFSLILFYNWVFDEDEKSKLIIGSRAFLLALSYMLFTKIINDILLF